MPTGLPVIPCRRVSRGLGSCPIPRSDTGAPMSRSLGRLHWLDSAPATATNSVAPAGHDHRNDACAGDAVAAVPDARCWEHPVRFGAGRKDPREEPARDRPRIRSRRGYVRRLSTAAAASRESAGRCRRRRPRSARWASADRLDRSHCRRTAHGPFSYSPAQPGGDRTQHPEEDQKCGEYLLQAIGQRQSYRIESAATGEQREGRPDPGPGRAFVCEREPVVGFLSVGVDPPGPARAWHSYCAPRDCSVCAAAVGKEGADPGMSSALRRTRGMPPKATWMAEAATSACWRTF